MRLLFVSLGCDKNLVDSEVMLALLNEKGYVLTDDEEQADIIIINTRPSCPRMATQPSLNLPTSPTSPLLSS